MAINLFEKQPDKINLKCSAKVSLPSSHVAKLSTTTTNCSINSKDGKSNTTRTNTSLKSPCFMGDNSVQFLARVTEKRYTDHKKALDFASSIPLAASIYRANSAKIKPQKRGNKKSVLTLPNAQTEMPQMHTVSDTNDSKVFDACDDKHKRTNKRLPSQNQNRKPRVWNKNYNFYDRDARYCSQMNIHLDCSSSDITSEYNRDGKAIRKIVCNKESRTERAFKGHDNIWAVLRNINRFQFKPSPPMSEDSVETVKKSKIRNKRKNKSKAKRLIETCRTEEAYITYNNNVSGDYKSPSNISPSSSLDRVTIIDKHEEHCGVYDKEKKKEILQARNVKSNSPLAVTDNKNHLKNTKTIRLKERQEIAFIQNTKIPIYINTSARKNPETFPEIKSSVAVAPQKTKKLTSYDGISRLQKCLPEYNDKSNNYDHSPQAKGITTVIVNKCSNNDIHNNKPGVKTTLPNCTQSVQKMTQNEIKKRLANMKFPIVISGKDQLCSSYIQVTNYEPIHLQILDKQIWPFMQDWYDKDIILNENKTGKDKKAGERARNIQVTRKYTISSNNLNTKKMQQNQPDPPNESAKIKTQGIKKSKPIHEIRDKRLKLLYKNPVKDIDEKCIMGDQVESSTSCIPSVEVQPINSKIKVDVATKTLMKHDQSFSKHIKKSPKTEELEKLLVQKQFRKKTISADQFIDTVIKKIRKGIYYNNDNDNKNESEIINFNEVAIQTVSAGNDFKIDDNLLIKAEIIQKKNNGDMVQETPKDTDKYLEPLPGFDEILPLMEIKTLSFKEIAVKHTNVQIHFDIAIPSELDSQEYNNMQKTTSFVPLKITGSHTKIYKSKTTLMNAMLPAEICSLLPKVIRSIADSKISVTPTLPSSTLPFLNDGLLYTISELSHTECHDIFKLTLPPVINIPLKLLKLLNGVFYTKEIHKVEKAIEMPTLKLRHYEEALTFLGKLSSQRLFIFKMDPFYKNLYTESNIIERKTVNYFNNKTSCNTLELYNKKNFALNTVFVEKNKILKKKWHLDSNIQIDMRINSMPLSLIYDGQQMIVTVTNNNKGFEEKSSITISNLNFNTLNREFETHSNTLNAIEYKETLHTSDKDSKPKQKKSNPPKFRKKQYVQLYKKCKSASNISGDYKNATPLSKIMSMDDFLQALGTGKMLSSIFDGRSEKKILSSISEMKHWITEIRQEQAMLVLLLNNKKDTPNLVRYRSILLQGIAVNRITRASELDMEIEVIERENFNKFSKFDGLPFMTEHYMENHDVLLEELYWIAKTTASDYQKPFNEASEKLLKSLLEKRKKLNPSYLRVMARYVGLGLLKSSSKN